MQQFLNTVKDISENYKISPDKIDEVYNGINFSFKPVSDLEAEIKNVFRRKRLFLFVGSLNPRKIFQD
ncbi:MAG: hypothetical protein IPJ32_16640 [Sphingobacteriaceae bacterium]|nr:hypothetical protein [Sphingobacteriaceae bacterium]